MSSVIMYILQKAESDLSTSRTSPVMEAKDKIITDLKTAIDEQENTMKVQDEVCVKVYIYLFLYIISSFVIYKRVQRHRDQLSWFMPFA